MSQTRSDTSFPSHMFENELFSCFKAVLLCGLVPGHCHLLLLWHFFLDGHLLSEHAQVCFWIAVLRVFYFFRSFVVVRSQ